MKSNAKNQFLVRVQNGEDEMQVLEEVVYIYMTSKNWDEASEKTGVHPQTLRSFVTRREVMFQKKNPILFKIYMDKTGNKRASRQQNDDLLEYTKAFSTEVFKSLPKKMLYIDFLNLMCTYRTNKLTSEDLVEMANEYGIEIVG